MKPAARRPPPAAGFTIIEVLIAAAIILVGIGGIASAFSAYAGAAGSAAPRVQATLLAEEGLEAARSMRDNSWSGSIGALSAGTPYFLIWSSGAWATTTAASEIDGTFYRTITVADVYRDGSDQIAASGGTLDPNTRLVTSSVSWWNRNATSTVSLSAYLNNLFGN